MSNGGIGAWEVEFGIGNDDDRGKALLWRIFQVSEEVTDPNEWRYLTETEKDLVLDNGFQIRKIDTVRVYHRYYRKLAFMLLGRTVRQVIAPNGDIFIPTPNDNAVVWSEDYTFESYDQTGKFLHELFHVYQFHAKYKLPVAFAAARGVNPPYTYILDDGKVFDDYNIEQQATMMQDRYLIRKTGTPSINAPANITLQELENVIPFEWANP